MSDTEETPAEEKPFCVDRAKQGRAACKKCKEKCVVGELRIAKLGPNPYGSGKMKNWHHLSCIFEQFLKQRATTRRIESPDDMDGWNDLKDEDKQEILKKIEESELAIAEKYGLKYLPKKQKANANKATPKKSPLTKGSDRSKTNSISIVSSPVKVTSPQHIHVTNKDFFFREFRRLVVDISNVSSYTEKTNLVSTLFTKGSDGKGFKGDVSQWCRLLLPGVVKRIYNLQSKQLVKLFSKIFHIDQGTIMEHLKQGDIGETIQHFFEESKHFQPAKKSVLTIQEVDDFLEELSKLTKEDEQMNHFKSFASKCTSNDLKIIIRLIKHDLRMNAGAKHILQGVHPDAYQAYQASRNLDVVISRCLGSSSKSNDEGRITANVNLMTPVQPMLAEPCKSIEQAIKKCPNGMYSEIKYDGERVQVHKCGNDFKYYSRSLKPVLAHKVSHFKQFIPKAFPHAKDLILDSEILMVDNATGNPLPFGSLGIHKKNEFKDARVCLFVFDCIYYNGNSLVKEPLEDRKKILQENMTEIPNRIMFSEVEIIQKPRELSLAISKAFEKGLEGLVLKDLKSIYEPGKRHWLKVKKDYLRDGSMADSADLIVLGAWYGTGKKAGMMSVFLMGCYDPETKCYYTVTKVHTGHDDNTLEQLQTELEMDEIACDFSKVPSWLKCTKTMIPDFVAKDPRRQPVWEVMGAEFTQHDVHTADGISIRFPRVSRIRSDKTWEDATSLEELRNLFQKSKEMTDFQPLTDVDELASNGKQATSSSIAAKRKIANATHNISKNGDFEPLPKMLKPDTTSSMETDGSKIKDPLPDYFKDVNLLIMEREKQKLDQWIRYFTAYGGIVLKLEKWKEATHVLHLDNSVKDQKIECPKSAKHVIVEWIKFCNSGL